MRTAAISLFFTMTLLACTKSVTTIGSSSSSSAIEDYCPYTSSPKSYTTTVTASGKAVYEYRVNGNGEIANGVHTLTPTTTTSGQQYSFTINGINVTWSCDQASCSATNAVTGLKQAIASLSASSTASMAASATGTSTLVLTPTIEGNALSISSLSNLSDSANSEPNPIRYAEVRATDSSGKVLQCAETDSSGNFSLLLPANTGSLTVAIASRSSNSYNTAYILNNPSDNKYYSLTTTVGTSSDTGGIRLVAKATGDLLGGAFNILDQILNAQNYLRAQTLNCDVGASSNYFPDCSPFTTAPLIKIYWTAGLSPGVYVGVSGGISYYLNGDKELYILGGINGDVDTSDMDHFDNSVIVHEYGHFIEDQFANPNSPGGSHNGNAIIDPRLAWGEGWADFFQAAVTGTAVYRDTYGHVGCTQSATDSRACYGVNFNENIDPASGTSYSDKPTSGARGEGNFREFAITRALWDVVKPTGGASRFSEIWAVLHGPTNGMKVVGDKFKSIGRFYRIQSQMTSHADWSSLIANEEQVAGLSDYATPIRTTTGCTPTSVSMGVYKSITDTGGFSTSDQFRNNDFYVYDHPGGSLTITATWSGSSTVDLDLYLYKTNYVYGSSSSAVIYNNDENKGTSGTVSMSGTVAAGTYMINVMAYTGIYSSSGTYNTNYSFTINGVTACPWL